MVKHKAITAGEAEVPDRLVRQRLMTILYRTAEMENRTIYLEQTIGGAEAVEAQDTARMLVIVVRGEAEEVQNIILVKGWVTQEMLTMTVVTEEKQILRREEMLGQILAGEEAGDPTIQVVRQRGETVEVVY
tara:strand:+ start:329 stop:724 length:396 start_codon:yes stop_codon:yes gene_type:complete